MRVFQPTYLHRKTGKRRHVSRWWVEVKDPHAALLYLSGFRDKARTQALGYNIERLIACRVSGAPVDPTLQRFVESLELPTMRKIRAKLVERDILGTNSLPLHRHLLAYLRHLQGKGNTAQHCRDTLARCSRVLRGLEATTWEGISVDGVRAFLQSLRKDSRKPISTTTANHHVRAVKMLSRWMYQQGRTSGDRLLACTMFKMLPDEKPRCERRALSVDEARVLLAATTRSDIRRGGMAGPERALLYRLAIETGLRVGELTSLTTASFDLEAFPATVRVEQGRTKNRKGALLNLSPATTELIRQHLCNKAPSTRAFAMPAGRHTAVMLRRDLEDVGISYRDAQGRKIDFHALRHTRGVWLGQYTDARPAEIRELMRVSSLALVDRYTRSLRVTREYADACPSLDVPAQAEELRASTD